MKISIGDKYLYIHTGDGRRNVYFEHFESKEEKRSVIKIAIENNEGRKFLTQNNYTIQEADVTWFGNRKLKRRVMFVKEKNGLDSLILITPKLLCLKK